MMGEDEGEVRRTGFAKDSREFFTKLITGLVVSFIIWGAFYVWKDVSMPWWLAIVLGEWAVFQFAKSIAGSSKHAD